MNTFDEIAKLIDSGYSVADALRKVQPDTQGTFTATLGAASGTITLLTTNDVMSYTLIGDTCFVRGRIHVDSVSAPSGALTLEGIPYSTSSESETADSSGTPIAYDSLASAVGVGVYVDWSSNQSVIRILEQTTTGGSNSMASRMQSGTKLLFNFFYKIA